MLGSTTVGLLLGFSCAEGLCWPSDPLSWTSCHSFALWRPSSFYFAPGMFSWLILFSLHCFVLYGHRYSKADIISAMGKSCLDHVFSLCDRKVVIVITIGSFPCGGLCRGKKTGSVTACSVILGVIKKSGLLCIWRWETGASSWQRHRPPEC